ncbi:MAG TPA: ABC transporter substrate-binding protein [Clostridia bacterium]|nr:ABC transporter substrate-binding protein [Clostridia bacterium]
MLKKLCGAIALAIALCFAAGCALSAGPEPAVSEPAPAGPEPPASAGGLPCTVTDAAGRGLTFDAIPERVVAVSASLGDVWRCAGGTLIGVTSDAKEQKSELISDSTQIIGTVKEPNWELILSLEPDFIIASADIASHVDFVSTLDKAGIKCGLFKEEFFEDYLGLLTSFCSITGRDDLLYENGLKVRQSMEETLEKAGDTFSGRSVLFIRAFSTGAKAKGDEDTHTGVMLKAFGLDNIASRHDGLLETLSLEEIATEDPYYIFIVVMGSDTQAGLDALYRDVQSNPIWSGLSAVKEGRCHVLDKMLFHYKPNSRWGEAYEELYKLLNS